MNLTSCLQAIYDEEVYGVGFSFKTDNKSAVEEILHHLWNQKLNWCIYGSPSQNFILNQPAQNEPSHSVPLNLRSKLDHKIFTEINY